MQLEIDSYFIIHTYVCYIHRFVEDVPSQGWPETRRDPKRDAGDLNMFGSDGRQNIIINNSKIYGNATGTPWGKALENIYKVVPQIVSVKSW